MEYSANESSQNQTNPKITLNSSAIFNQDIPRVTPQDVLNLDSQRKKFIFREKLDTIFQNFQNEQKYDEDKNEQQALFSNYIDRTCFINCPNRSTKIPSCFSCVLGNNNLLLDDIDETIYLYSLYSKYTDSYCPHIILLNKIFLSEDDIKNLQYHFSPQLQPTRAELTAIIKIIIEHTLSTRNFKKAPNIFYNQHQHTIHFQIARRLLELYNAPDIITKDRTPTTQVKKYIRESTILFNKFCISPTDQTQAQTNYKFSLDSFEAKLQSLNGDNKFTKLIQTLYHLTNGNTDTIDQLATLIAKIYIGRAYLKDLGEFNNLTVILTPNPLYVKEFLLNILLYAVQPRMDPKANKIYGPVFPQKSENDFYHVTEYSMATLSNEKNIAELIKDKVMGNIVNIDTTLTKADTGTLKKLIDGTALIIYDNIFGKLTYRSNAHYIRIVETTDDIGFNTTANINYATIICNGNLQHAIYEPLEEYELFFLLYGFLNYGMDLLGRDPKDEASSNIQHEDCIKDFLGTYCEDSPSDADIEYADTLYDEYTIWFQCMYQNTGMPTCSDFKFKQILKSYYGERYEKHNGKLNGKRKDANGVTNLKLKQEELKQRLADIEAKISSQEQLQATFIQYMENILSNYCPHAYE